MTQPNDFSELIADVREQVLYMQELGVELLNADIASTAVERSSEAAKVDERKSKFVPVDVPTLTVPKASAKKLSRLSALPSLSNRPATQARTEITDVVTPADAPKPTQEKSAMSALFEVGPTLPDSRDTIEIIRAEIGDCSRCPLHAEGRKQIVHSTGNYNADLMFVGEAPGADEDEQGFPFVGRAGQLLTRIIEGIGFKREQVFIGNINRCRPKGNRTPTPDEAVICRPFLLREVAVVRPKVIVVLGNVATQNLLNTKVGITKLRGNFQDYFGVKVMPTFHPAYLLRDPNKKKEVWEDMKKVRDYLAGVSE
jgi:DNA polymerase